MPIESLTVLNQNITLVYAPFETQQADTKALKAVLQGQFKPMIMDTPEVIVAAYPPTALNIQIADNRIRVTLQEEGATVGEFPIWQATIDSLLTAPSESNLIAFGFNYDLGLILADQDAHRLMMDCFLSNKESIEKSLEVSVWSFVPRIRFTRGDTRYELVFEPLLDSQRIKVHFNAHFQMDDKVFPQEKLEELYRAEYDFLTSAISRLLNQTEGE